MAFDVKQDIRDRDLEKDGAWMEWDEDTRFLIARKTSPRYKAAFSKGYRENERLLSSKTNTKRADDIAEELMLGCMAEHLLLGWEGVTDAGKKLPYSVEVAKFMIEEHDDLRIMIDEFSETRANFIHGNDKRDAENLEK